ncbi:MAG TPA: 2'-5' RNA ligase family protein [Dokdonella sp.]|nr:2'-5' RNA ligase family protein [Dokdonella sp.]
MHASAFIVEVPEAEAHVGSLRERHDASVQLGVPAHITVLSPFMPPERIDDVVIERVRAACATVPAFAFELADVARFAATAYLAPQPAAPFVALTRALVRAFPDYPPFGGQFETIIPHLTVAHGDAAEAERAATELAAIMRDRGPIASRCAAVTLLENSSGTWRRMHGFALPPGPAHA